LDGELRKRIGLRRHKMACLVFCSLINTQSLNPKQLPPFKKISMLYFEGFALAKEP
jgi:hypothetical protein